MMLYGVDFLTYSKGIHGVALFKEENEAISFVEKLNYLWFDEELTNKEELYDEYNIAFENMYAIIDEIDHREITGFMNEVLYSKSNNGFVSTYCDDVKIINFTEYVYIP